MTMHLEDRLQTYRRHAAGRRHLARAVMGVAAALAVGVAAADVVVLCGRAEGRVAGAASEDRVNEPFAVDLDADGRLYGVEYTRGNRLFRIDDPAAAEPRVEFVAGVFHVSSDKDRFPPDRETSAATVRFHGLHDVAVGRDGRVFVADTFQHRVRCFDPRSGRVDMVAGTGEPGFSGDGGPATAAAFNQAYCGSLVPGGERLLVADVLNARLRAIDLRTGLVATVAGTGRAGRPIDGVSALESPLAGPRAACAAADGTIYLALREGNALVEIRAGRLRTVVNAAGKAGWSGDGGLGRDARLAGPKYVALDGAGRVLIADTENHCIRRYDPRSGKITTVAGVPTQAGATVGSDLLTTKLARPHGCRVAPDGRLVIADSDNDRILAGRVAE
ncbi:MAG: hypothetical protein ACKO40_07685 [Planctomycetaceae bacterium]